MLLLVAGAPVAALVARAVGARGTVELRATMPETGGWQPPDLTVAAGEPLRLRLTSGDVVHGFAIAQTERPSVEVLPGQVTEVTLTFDRPGTYTYYCTRWCGPNHWRMRGTIEVTGNGDPADPPAPAPYIALGIDLDAPHPAETGPTQRPSAARGAAFRAAAPESLLVRAYLRRYSPADVFQTLGTDASAGALTDQQRWDLVAWAWRATTTAEILEAGAQLYRRNCAACHGESGRGDGVMAGALADAMPGLEEFAPDTGNGETTVEPADFTRPDLLGASPVLLHGKIVRGGMGTQMPYWGPIFTDAQVWALVDHLYGFQFDYRGNAP